MKKAAFIGSGNMDMAPPRRTIRPDANSRPLRRCSSGAARRIKYAFALPLPVRLASHDSLRRATVRCIALLFLESGLTAAPPTKRLPCVKGGVAVGDGGIVAPTCALLQL